VITPEQGEEGNDLATNFKRKVSLEKEDCKDELALGFYEFICTLIAITIIQPMNVAGEMSRIGMQRCIMPLRIWGQEANRMQQEAIALRMEVVAIHLENQASRI
jgi:hypothetical protein